jgi:5-(carboxyamino)imidazole ribonucleotide synthase
MIGPGAMLGMLGGGQLGRMFTLAAHAMGYRVTVLDPDPLSPAGAIADVHLKGAYQDREALQQLADSCSAVTTEFENVPSESLRWLAAHCTVRPSGDSVAIAQDRIREKRFLVHSGLRVAPFLEIASERDCTNADLAFFPGVLKRARFGYDGKGQARVASPDEARSAFAELGSEPCVLEQFIALEREVSVIAARGVNEEVAIFPVAENRHRNGILDVTLVPAGVSAQLAERAAAWARTIGARLNYVGVFAVEFFVSTAGDLLVNEIAPRPHNSGHYTIDACVTSQFEQQVRSLCGVPLGETKLLSPAVMVNMLGDLWENGEPDWARLLACRTAKLHLYGKHEARPGRKMGHYTVLAETVQEAFESATAIRSGMAAQFALR